MTTRELLRLTNDTMFDHRYIYAHEEDYKIYAKCKMTMDEMTSEQKEMLQEYLAQGERIVKDVVQMVSRRTLRTKSRIETAAMSIMNMEPYIVFYKKHMLNEPKDFVDIQEWAKIVVKKVRYKPSYQARLMWADGLGNPDNILYNWDRSRKFIT